MLVLGQTFEMVAEQHAIGSLHHFLFNPLPCASKLIVGYQSLSETALKIILILHIKLEHYKD